MTLGMTVRECQSRVSSEEFSEWMAYYQVEPWGEWRADLRCGIQSAAAVMPYTKRKVSPSDFMPRFTRKSRKPQSIEEQQAIIEKFLKG